MLGRAGVSAGRDREHQGRLGEGGVCGPIVESTLGGIQSTEYTY